MRVQVTSICWTLGCILNVNWHHNKGVKNMSFSTHFSQREPWGNWIKNDLIYRIVISKYVPFSQVIFEGLWWAKREKKNQMMIAKPPKKNKEKRKSHTHKKCADSNPQNTYKNSAILGYIFGRCSTHHCTTLGGSVNHKNHSFNQNNNMLVVVFISFHTFI